MKPLVCAEVSLANRRQMCNPGELRAHDLFVSEVGVQEGRHRPQPRPSFADRPVQPVGIGVIVRMDVEVVLALCEVDQVALASCVGVARHADLPRLFRRVSSGPE